VGTGGRRLAGRGWGRGPIRVGAVLGRRAQRRQVVDQRNSSLNGLVVVEVTRELEKVTWPTRKETSAATVVVLVTVLISALILSGFDAIWSFFTNWFLR